MKHVLLSIAIITIACINLSASAQPYYIPFKIPDHPAVNNANLGTAFGADGNRFYVSGQGNFIEPDTSPGGVYQFDRNTYQYIQTYAPVGHPWDDFYGTTMQYDDGVLLVGAPYAQGTSVFDHGAAYLINPVNGSVLHTFNEETTDTSFGFFGASVSINDAGIFVGAINYGPTQQGNVFVYHPTNHNLMVTLAPDPATTDDRYGSKIDHNDDYLVVSAPGTGFETVEGAVYVYDFITGALLYRLTSPIPDLEGDAGFGYEIELAGDILLVSVFEFGSFDIRGKVFVYDLTTGDHIRTLTGNSGNIFDRFGYSMSVEGNIAVISAERDNDVVTHGGAVYIYNLDTFELIDKVLPPMLNRPFMQFGETVHIQNGTIFASAIDPRVKDIQTDQHVVYILEQFCRGDINLDGNRNFLDVSAFLKFAIDYNEDGSFNFLDISAFLQAFATECP
ncbi:MAG: FG-GAP repeat protein [Phycisphaerales bacterium]|nr:FG-GAP repeat protein [Phycisphaerales bacterium]